MGPRRKSKAMARLPPDRDICRLTKTEARVGIGLADRSKRHQNA